MNALMLTDDLSPEAEDQIFEHLEKYRAEVAVFDQMNELDIQQNKIWMTAFQEKVRQDSVKIILRRRPRAPKPR